MSGFLYFIEGTKAAPSEILEAAGLSHALDEGQVTTRETTKGPSGHAGIILAHAGMPARDIKYSPPSQTWTPIENAAEAPAAYIGYATNDPPGPEDLLRDTAILDGYAIEMESAGGIARWFIPRARIYTEDVNGGTIDGPDSDLPQAIAIVGGEIVAKPLPRYRQACLDAERIWAAVMAANDDGPEKDAVVLTAIEEAQLAIRILGINYRLGIPEANALGVITTTTKGNIIQCFVDFPGYAKVQIERAEAKKAEPPAEAPDTESSNSGPPAG